MDSIVLSTVRNADMRQGCFVSLAEKYGLLLAELQQLSIETSDNRMRIYSVVGSHPFSWQGVGLDPVLYDK